MISALYGSVSKIGRFREEKVSFVEVVDGNTKSPLERKTEGIYYVEPPPTCLAASISKPTT